MKPFPLRRGAMLLVVAGLTLTACAGSSDGPQKPSNTTIPEFTFSLPTLAKSMDMTSGADVATAGIPAATTQFLEAATLSGYKPVLAEKTSTPDPTTIVYDLRPEVKFSDGSDLAPADVVWSFKHAQRAKASNASLIKSVESVTETGPMQVTVKLSKPDPSARFNIADTSVPIMQATFGEAHPDDLGTPDAVPIGTGPYVATSVTPSKISMTRNPHYWGTKPAPDKLNFVVIGDDTKAQLAVRSGEVQGTRVSDLRTFDQWKKITGATTYAAPQMMMDFYGFDTRKAPFDDVHFRRAVAYSIDRKGLVQAGFGGQASLLQSLAPLETVRGSAPSAEEADTFLDSLPQYDLDPAKAKAELAQSKYATYDGEVKIQFVAEIPWSKLVALNLQENLKALGIRSSVETYTYSDWLDAFYSGEMKTPTPMFFTTTPDAGSISYPIDPSSGYNFSHFASERTDAALGDLTSDKSWDAAKTILTELADQVPYVPLFQEKTVFVLSKGYVYTQKVTALDFQTGAYLDYLRPAK
ncbi:ABC transporter substrate-binding protein [Aeromicrobium endophyticum]|nr:ABC transporter substrate-binding protein [Aeromicrobium endophyticum]